MQGESPQEALMRAAQVAGYRAAEDASRVQDRLVTERVLARDEDGVPRLRLVEPQIEDADEREASGIF